MDNYDKIIKKFEDACAMPRSVGKMVSSSYIFDEDKSVKWNREEVERHNQQVKENNQRCAEERYNAFREAEASVVNYLQAEYPKISVFAVEGLYKYVYEKKYFDNYNIEEVLEMCEEILEIFSEKHD